MTSGTDHSKTLYNDYTELLSKSEKLGKNLKAVKEQLRLEKAEHLLEKKRADKYAAELAEKNMEIARLSQEIARLNAKLNADGTNSGIPTSMTPLNKEKVVPNTRVRSGKKKGAQSGHEKHKLEAFKEEEIDETIAHNVEICPDCGEAMEETGDFISKDETEYKLVVIKKRHVFNECKCPKCGKIARISIPNNLKEENQYGSNLQAFCLTLANVGNVPINKIKRIVYGLSCEEIDLSEGYITKLQKRAAENLENFIADSKNYCRSASILHWDDTVINISTNRACLRFYGDDKVALYTAHTKKNKEGLDEDEILSLIPDSTVVVHDHNMVNYNDEYFFKNAECCVHLLRDLEKLYQNSKHEWPNKLAELFKKTNSDRNAEITAEKESFSDEYIKSFEEQYEEILLLGLQTHKETEANNYYWTDERALLNRLIEYKDNYCMWVHNFDVPFTNNLAERGLRGAKTKMKVSGQFQNIKSAQNYAAIRTYIETCRRNGVNETEALQRLCSDNPYSLAEIFQPRDAE